MNRWHIVSVSIVLSLYISISLWSMCGQVARASEIQHRCEKDFLENSNLSEMDRILEKYFPEKRMSFKELVTGLMDGTLEWKEDLIRQFLKERFFYVVRENSKSIRYMMVIMIGGAALLQMTSIFQNKQVGAVSFIVIQLLLAGICITSLQTALVWAEDGVHRMTRFIEVLYPVYAGVMIAAKGGLSGTGFHQLVILLIFVADQVMLRVLLPIIRVYAVIRILNSLRTEAYLSKMGEVLELITGWLTKGILSIVVGGNVIQGMVAPAVDSLGRNALTRGVEVIPGIGDAIGGAAEVVIGTAVIIKNSVGLAGVLICLALCTEPVVQIGILTLEYKLAAAIMQPVADSRMLECISGIGDGCRMLLKAVSVNGVLFALTIAIAAYTTN